MKEYLLILDKSGFAIYCESVFEAYTIASKLGLKIFKVTNIKK